MLADTIDDLVACPDSIHHLLDCVNIVLQVCINADDRITVGGEQACDQGILVPSVSREFDADDMDVCCDQSLDQIPRPIGAAIVDEVDLAIGADLPCIDESAKK